MPSENTAQLPKATISPSQALPLKNNDAHDPMTATSARQHPKRKLRNGLKKFWQVVAGDDGPVEMDLWDAVLSRNALGANHVAMH